MPRGESERSCSEGTRRHPLPERAKKLGSQEGERPTHSYPESADLWGKKKNVRGERAKRRPRGEGFFEEKHSTFASFDKGRGKKERRRCGTIVGEF